MDNAAAKALAQSLLQPGETLVWSEVAPASTYLTAGLTTTIICGLFLIFVTIIVPRTVDLKTQRVPMLLVVLFSVPLSIATLFGIHQIISASTTAYMITDRRAAIIWRYPWRGANDYGPEALERYGIDGDTLDFNWRDAHRRSQRTVPARYEQHFYELEDPEEVAALIKTHLAPNAQRIDEP